MPDMNHHQIHSTPKEESRHPAAWLGLKALLLASLLLSGCIRMDTPVEPSATPLPPTATATVFFPTLIPTSTSTPPPSPTPVPDRLPELEELLFEDTFDSEQAWTATSLDTGGASLVGGRLGVAVRRSQSYFTVISPASSPGYFYAEVNVRTEICSDNSDVGLMFHTSPGLEHYRFTINCDGDAQVVLASAGSEVALVPLTSTNVVRPGTSSENQLAVLADGPFYVFFINGQEVFSTRNASLREGSFGVIVRSRSSEQTTVTFDDFRVWRVPPGSSSP